MPAWWFGLLDEHERRIFTAGHLGNGPDGDMNGDTIFEIGSVTRDIHLVARAGDKVGTLRIKDTFPNTSAPDASLRRGLIVQRINGIPTQWKALADCVSIGKQRAD